MAVLSFLDRDRSIAGPGFSRWLVPPAALAIHLSHRPGVRVQRIQDPDDHAASASRHRWRVIGIRP